MNLWDKLKIITFNKKTNLKIQKTKINKLYCIWIKPSIKKNNLQLLNKIEVMLNLYRMNMKNKQLSI